MCSPAYVSHCRHADEQRVARSRLFGDQCESACEDQGKSDQLEAVICGGEYLRETFEFCGALIH